MKANGDKNIARGTTVDFDMWVIPCRLTKSRNMRYLEFSHDLSNGDKAGRSDNPLWAWRIVWITMESQIG